MVRRLIRFVTFKRLRSDLRDIMNLSDTVKKYHELQGQSTGSQKLYYAVRKVGSRISAVYAGYSMLFVFLCTSLGVDVTCSEDWMPDGVVYEYQEEDSKTLVSEQQHTEGPAINYDLESSTL